MAHRDNLHRRGRTYLACDSGGNSQYLYCHGDISNFAGRVRARSACDRRPMLTLLAAAVQRYSRCAVRNSLGQQFALFNIDQIIRAREN